MKKWLFLLASVLSIPALAQISVIQVQNNGTAIRTQGGGIFRLNFSSGCTWDSLNGRVTCNFGAGGSLASGTTNAIIKYTDGPNGQAGDSCATDDGTTFTIGCSGGAVTSAGGRGLYGLGGSVTAPNNFPPTNKWGFLGPTSAITTPWFFQPGNAGPSSAGIFHAGAVSGNISALTFGLVVEGDMSLSDLTTLNVSTSQHGFVPKLPNDNTKYLDGSGAFSVPAGSGGSSGVGKFSSAIDFPSIPDGACNDQTFTATGVVSGTDVTIAGWPSSLPTGLFGSMFVSAADTVKVRLCNLSGAAVDPASLTYKVTLAVYNLNGSSAIDFASISDGACLANTFTLTGTAAGDPVVPGWPSALNTGLFGSMVASATDTVQVRLCNLSGAAVDPASLTYKASIAK